MILDFHQKPQLNYFPRNPDFKTLIEEKLKGQAFMRHIGFELSTIEAGYVEGSAPLAPFLTQQDGYVHGGVTSTLADIVTGFAAFSLVEKDEKVVTAELKVNYFSPGKGNQIWAKGYVVKPGKRFLFCEGEIWVESEDDYLMIARTYSTMAVFKPGILK